MNSILTQHLDPVLAKLRFRRVCIALVIAWTLTAVVCAGMLAANRWGDWYSETIIPVSLAIAIVSTLVALAYGFGSRMSRIWVAKEIEKRFPDLDSGLMTALEQQPQRESEYSFLQQEVIRKAIYHDIRHSWPSIVPRWQTFTAPLATVVSLLFVVAILTGLFFFVQSPQGNEEEYLFSEVVVSDSVFSFDVEPGNTEVEKGTGLLVLARFSGSTPPNAFLEFRDEMGNKQTIEMNKSLDDPVFAGRITNVTSPSEYRIQLDQQASQTYHVDVFQFPKLDRADVGLDYPEYTGLPKKIIQDIRRFSAIEGTFATFSFYLNKPVEKAVLVNRSGVKLELVADSQNSKLYRAEFAVSKSDRFELILEDSNGRTNQVPPRFVVNVLPNQTAKLKVISPARDVDVSPIEELVVAATAWDDFGLQRVGLNYVIPGEVTRDIVLAETVAGRQETPVEHLIAFEALQAKPDQMLAYYFWAEEFDGSGQLRRTSSDMYFANVRPFDEIYRQGQQPTADQQRQQQQQNQQGQQNAQNAQAAADTQKEIVNATWKVVRREGIRDTVSESFPEDVQLTLDAQTSMNGQVDKLAENLTDAQSLKHVEDIKKAIAKAEAELARSKRERSVAALEDALAAEQVVMQDLLKLRNREHQIVQQQRNQQQQGQQQQNNRQQRQLQQMQMREDENRYENQQLAQPEQSPEEREDRQVLNRLRELAQRQNDLNERVKELQAALEMAEDEEERKEVEKQLKRLREEQQKILRDTDELSERMNQADNQQRMDEQSKQLDNARENIQQSAEALEKGEVSQAAAEGTRAQEQLKDLEEEFQKRTSGQFNRQVQQMRNQARELEERQKEIAENIRKLEDSDPDGKQKKSLRVTDERLDLKDDLEKQKEDLNKLTDSMKKTIEQAEDVEPLLAQELYESYRDNLRSQTEKSLDATQRSLEQGWVDDAKAQEQRANEGIRQLREGIERAADSVLGDEAEALRRANQELDRARRELEEEIDRLSPDGDSGSRSDDKNNTQNRERPEGSEKQNSGQDRDKNRRDDSKSKRSGNRSDKDASNDKGSKSNSSEDDKSKSGQNQSNRGKQRNGKGKDSKGGQPQQQREGQQREGQQRGGQQRGGQQSGVPNGPRSLRGGDPNQRFDPNAPTLNRNSEREAAPLTGEDFREWSDRLRDVEEIVDDPELRAEAARIRERARAVRRDLQERHSVEPNWDLVRIEILDPLVKLQKRVREEIIRKSGRKSLVPIDRDPVPPEFQDAVNRYYKQLGTGK